MTDSKPTPASPTEPAPGESGTIARLSTAARWVARNKVGILAAVGYIATIIGANYAIGHWGDVPVAPGAPHTLPVGFGWSAPSGVLFVSLALVTRDLVQWTMRRPVKPRPIDVAAMVGLIAVGAGVSFAVAEDARRILETEAGGPDAP